MAAPGRPVDGAAVTTAPASAGGGSSWSPTTTSARSRSPESTSWRSAWGA